MRRLHPNLVFPSRSGRSKLKKRKSSLAPDDRIMANVEGCHFSIPPHLRQPAPIQDELATETSAAQQDTVAECLPFLMGMGNPSRSLFDFNEHCVQRLDRHGHIQFLHQSLEKFPATFVAVDSSRPWMVYWALMGLWLLGEDVTQYRGRLVTLRHHHP